MGRQLPNPQSPAGGSPEDEQTGKAEVSADCKLAEQQDGKAITNGGEKKQHRRPEKFPRRHAVRKQLR